MLLRHKTVIPDSLAATELARLLPIDELETLTLRGTSVELPAGRTVINEDTFGREFLVIVDGSLSVSRDGASIARLDAGDIVGEMALLENQMRSATVSVLADATVLAFNRREFASLLDECPVFAAYVVATAKARGN